MTVTDRPLYYLLRSPVTMVLDSPNKPIYPVGEAQYA
jgi:hypothetical protein